jgi:hypothetical protein
MTHAILSPSAAGRWLACPPSARFEEQIPGETSPYAEEGTLAHELAALLLSARAGVFRGDQARFNDMVNQVYANAAFSREMYDHAEDYAGVVLDKGGDVLVEHRYDLSGHAPGSFGTADATVFTRDAVHVIDYKYGAGVRVSARENKQLMLYALGALDESRRRGMTPAAVVLTIVQPRAGGVSSWEEPVKALERWAVETLRPRAVEAIAGGGEFAAGEHCRFCKARPRCRAYFALFEKMEGVKDAREMTDDELALVLRHGDTLSEWITSVIKNATARLETGQAIPGFKLVEGRGRRSFTDETAVAVMLGELGYALEEIYDTKMRAMTDIEKRMGKKAFAAALGEYVQKTPGAPKLAPEDDDRPAVSAASLADEYGDGEKGATP